MNILLTTVVVLAMLGGLYLANAIFSGQKPPLSAANIHGSIGIILAILAGYNAYSMNSGQLWMTFAILTLASIGGFYLVSNQKKGQAGPRKVVIIHGIIGLLAYS